MRLLTGALITLAVLILAGALGFYLTSGDWDSMEGTHVSTTQTVVPTTIKPPVTTTRSTTTRPTSTAQTTTTQTTTTKSPAPTSTTTQVQSSTVLMPSQTPSHAATTAMQVAFMHEVDCSQGFSGIVVNSGESVNAGGTGIEIKHATDSRSLLVFSGVVPPQFEVVNLMIFVSTNDGDYCYMGGLSTNQIGYDEWGQSDMFVVSPEADRGSASGTRVTKVIVGTN